MVDRPGWIRANVDGFRVVLKPLVDKLRERTQGAAAPSRPASVISSVGSRVTGIQAGLILAYLSGRVLGQYELFLPPETSPVDGQRPGRLTLVAPNIVMIVVHLVLVALSLGDFDGDLDVHGFAPSRSG